MRLFALLLLGACAARPAPATSPEDEEAPLESQTTKSPEPELEEDSPDIGDGEAPGSPDKSPDKNDSKKETREGDISPVPESTVRWAEASGCDEICDRMDTCGVSAGFDGSDKCPSVCGDADDDEVTASTYRCVGEAPDCAAMLDCPGTER